MMKAYENAGTPGMVQNKVEVALALEHMQVYKQLQIRTDTMNHTVYTFSNN